MALLILSPLAALAIGPKSSTVSWTNSTRSIFFDIKKALAKLVTLKFYDPACHLQLTIDASDVAIGSVLQQIRNHVSEPLEFFQNLSILPRKTFPHSIAIRDSVKYFRNYLNERTFSILIDHKPLFHLFTLHNPFPGQFHHINSHIRF